MTQVGIISVVLYECDEGQIIETVGLVANRSDLLIVV